VNHLAEREGGRAPLALGFILLLAGGLRGFAVGRHGFWQDEIHSIHVARDLSRVGDPLMGHAPLYYALLRGWLAVGESEAWVRGLSVVIGLLCVASLYFVARADVGEKGALLAAWLAAVSPAAIGASREARGYGLLALTAMVAFWALRRAGESGLLRYWLLLGLSSAVALYTHYYAVFVLAALGLVALLPSRVSLPRRLIGFASAILVAGLLFLPWLPVFLAGQKGLAGYAREVNRFATGHSYSAKTLLYLLARTDPPHLLGAAAEAVWPDRSFTALSLGAFVLLLALVVRRIVAEGARSRLLPWTVMSVAPVVLAVIGHYAGNVIVGSRYVAFTGLFLGVPTAGVLAGFAPWVRRAAAVLAMMLGLIGSWSLYSRPMSQIREGVRFIDAQAGPGDCVVTVSNKAFVYRYYSQRPLPSFNLPWDAPGIERRVTPASPLAERAIREEDLPAILALLHTCRTTFVLYNETTVWGVDMGASRLRRALDLGGIRRKASRQFSDTVVEAYGP